MMEDEVLIIPESSTVGEFTALLNKLKASQFIILNDFATWIAIKSLGLSKMSSFND